MNPALAREGVDEAEVGAGRAQMLQTGTKTVKRLRRRPHAIVDFRRTIQADGERVEAIAQGLHVARVEEIAVRSYGRAHAAAARIAQDFAQTGVKKRLSTGNREDLKAHPGSVRHHAAYNIEIQLL